MMPTQEVWRLRGGAVRLPAPRPELLRLDRPKEHTPQLPAPLPIIGPLFLWRSRGVTNQGSDQA